MKKWWIFFLCLSVLLPYQNGEAQDGREETIIDISNPVDGGVVSGEVQIIGSAGHPTRFDRYEVEFRNLQNTNRIWLPISQTIRQQRTNEVLAIWNTVGSQIADGQYQIRLLVYLQGSDEPEEFIVDDVQVLNTPPTDLPTVQGPTPTQIIPPTPGPSPTSLVEQPPASTPAPTYAPLEPIEETGGSDTPSNTFSINLDTMTSAFCNGVFISFGFFGIIIAYLWMRSWLRPVTRRVMWQIRNELDNNNDRRY